MNEDFNYLELFYDRIKSMPISKRQKEDLRIELDKMRRSFKSIAPITTIGAIDRSKHPLQVDSLQWKYVFVNIWASWCYLSRTQIPFIKNAYQKFRSNKNIEFVNIAIDDNFLAWNDFLTREKFEMKHDLCDTLGKNASILKRFGLDYVPANFLLDRDGSILTSNLKDDNVIFTIDAVLREAR